MLYSSLPQESIALLEQVGSLFGYCSVRLVDMTEFHESVKDATLSYITAETN